MSIILTGSLAYDHIMVFPDRFKNHILADKVHVLNVAFNVNSLARHFGGTAGNIAYNLHLLEERPLIVGTAGKDFADYKKRIRSWKLPTQALKILPNQYTAQAFITTDLDDNQITAFHGGAMFSAHLNPLKKYLRPNDLAIISPNGIRAMCEHTQACRHAGVRFIFDPGQSLPAFKKEEFLKTVRGAEALVCNDYEWSLVKNKTGLDENKIFLYAQTLIVTYGEKGSEIFTPQKRYQIPAAKARKIVDPTGCGDAYRAGLLYGLKHGWDWPRTGKLASALAAKAVETSGTQNHEGVGCGILNLLNG